MPCAKPDPNSELEALRRQLTELEDECENLRVSLEDENERIDVLAKQGTKNEKTIHALERNNARLTILSGKAAKQKVLAKNLRIELREAKRELRSSDLDLKATLRIHKEDVENLQALNEELQSTNEEMETANEEIEASNEALLERENELTAIHLELEKRVDERTTALKESEARLAGILDIAPEAVIAIDDNLKISLFNQGAERIFGYGAGEVLGRSLGILMPKRFRKGHSEQIEGFADSRDDYRLMSERSEISGLRKDGTEFPASASVSKLEIGNEKIFTVLLHDITERKQVEEDRRLALVEAEKANKAKSEFLAAVSHELRTPLNAILGFADILNHQYFGPPGEGKYREYAADIYSSGEHLLELVNDLLDISTIEAGKQSLTMEKLAAKEIIAESVGIVDEKAREGGIDLLTKVPEDVPVFYADRRAIRQILLNLLVNAIKFTPKGGKVAVSIKGTKKKVTFKIADTGKGIPAKKIPELTNPFTRLEQDPHISAKGWGLGLAITKSLVDLHDGKMKIKSTVGKGTTVTVTLPNVASTG